MRAVAVLLLPALAALVCVGVLTLATGDPKPATQSFVWKKRVFKNKQQFTVWLNRRNVKYSDWAARHPGASPPWERGGDGGGLGVFALLATLLAGIAAVVVFTRDSVRRSARRAFLSVLARAGSEDTLRPLAEARASVPLRDAVSAYGLRRPRGPQRSREPERPELVLVDAPPAKADAVVEPEPDAVAVEPPRDPPVVAKRKRKAAAEPPPKRRRRPAQRTDTAAVETLPPIVAPPVEEPVTPEAIPRPAASSPVPESEVEETAPSINGASPDPVPRVTRSAEAPQPTAPPSLRLGEVVCEVAFWRGYLSGQFYARIWGDDGLSAVATSPMFRCRSVTPEQTEERLAALAALRDHLIAEGWEPNGHGGAWYSARFTRQLRPDAPAGPELTSGTRGQAGTATVSG
jgi:hypothetical protein